MTASPTAIPRCEASAHHKPSTPPPAMESSFLSRSPPKPMVSPIYTSAGRSAFSLPGPNSSSTSPTTTSWYSAGFASNNSQRVRSPSTVTPQRDSFFETHAPAHYRATSFGSASRSSSISSSDLMNEPTTPKAMDGVPSGRIPSMSMNGSFDQMKGHRGSWGANANAGWGGFNNLRGGSANSPPLSTVDSSPSSYSKSGGMSGILNKFTFGGATARVPSSAPVVTSASLPSADEGFTVVQPVEVGTRGRQASLGGGPMQKRRPSPMGERLLMGHFNAH